MDFEEIIEDLGSFGHWQRVIYVFICLADVIGAFGMLVPIFVGATPKWKCNRFKSKLERSSGVEEIISLPNQTDELCNINNTFFCVNVTFHDDFTSIVSEWDLVCDNKYVTDLINTIQLSGILVGAAIAGQLANSIGRKKTYFISFTSFIVSGFISAFSTHWQMYAGCRFFVGLSFGGLNVVNSIYPLEFVGIKWRTICGSVGFWGFGGMILALCAYLVREWRHLIILTTVSGISYFVLWPFIPESPRWLAINNKQNEAKEVLNKIAKKNKKKAPDLAVLEAFTQHNESRTKANKMYSYLDLFRTRKYCKRSLFLVVLWFTLYLIYYGITYNLRNMSGNKYLNVFYAGWLDTGSMVFVVIFNNLIGRRFSQLFTFCLGLASSLTSLGIIASGFQDSYPRAILASALIGKLSASCGWYVLGIWTAELYPTAIRDQGTGFASVAGRLGGMVAPQIFFLAYYNELIPYIVSTVLIVVSIPLLFGLDETNNRPLEDVIDPPRGSDHPHEEISNEII